MKILIVVILIMILLMTINTSIATLFRGFDRDYYKPIRTNNGFAGKKVMTSNIKAKEIDMKIYHLRNISMEYNYTIFKRFDK